MFRTTHTECSGRQESVAHARGYPGMEVYAGAYGGKGMTYQAAVVDTFYSRDLDILISELDRHGIKVDVFQPEIKDLEELADYDVVVVQHLKFGRELVEQLDPERCRLVVRMGVGYDELDLPALTEKGIMAANVPGYGPDSVGQHTLQYMLSLAGHANEYHHRATNRRDLDLGKGPTGEDRWTGESRIPSIPLHRSVLGIIGYGRIGKKVAELSRPLFRSILVCDPYQGEAVFLETGIRRVNLEQLLETTDFVTLHVPLFEHPQRVYLGFEDHYRPTERFYRPTIGMMGEEQIAQMKDGSFLINTCRGEVVKESAVIEALIRGKLAGVAMDVFEKEPLGRTHPLRTMADGDLPERHPLRDAGQEKYNIILTFHSAYYLRGVFRTVEELTAEEIIRVLIHRQLPQHLVNPEVLSY